MAEYFLSTWRSYITGFSGLDKNCWDGIVINFFESVLIGGYYFLPIYFMQYLKYDLSTSGFIISFYGLGAVMGGFLGGKFSDMTTPGLVSIISLFIQILVFIFLLKLKSVFSLSVVLFFMGITSYGFITANHLWVLNHCYGDDVKKLKAINLMSVAANLGLGLSALIFSFFLGYGLDNIVYGSCGLLLLSTLYFSHVELRNVKSNNKSYFKNLQSTKLETKKPCRSLFYLSLICLFLVGLIIFQSNTTYSLYIRETFPEYGVKGVGILFALNAFLVVILSPTVNVLSKHNKVFLMGVGAFLLGFSMLMLNFAFVFAIAVLATFINTVGEIIFFSVAQLICYNNGNKKGRNLGFFRMTYASCRVVAPCTGAYIFQHCGYKVLWYLFGLIGLTCLVVCNYFKKYSI